MPLSIMPAISNLADQAPTAMTPVVLPSLGLDVPRITKLDLSDALLVLSLLDLLVKTLPV